MNDGSRSWCAIRVFDARGVVRPAIDGDTMRLSTWTWLPASMVGLMILPACSVEAPTNSDDDTDQGGNGNGGSSAGGMGPGGMGPGGGSNPATMPTCNVTTLTFEVPACAACAEGSCCMPLEACDSSTACLDYLGCIQACEDEACADNCAATNAEGEMLLGALDNCLDTTCSDECTTSFPICDSGLVINNEACATCLGDSCCADLNTCVAEADCETCITDPAGDAACTASALDEPVRDCWTMNCEAACGMVNF